MLIVRADHGGQSLVLVTARRRPFSRLGGG